MAPVPEDVAASLFVNTEMYLVLANYGSQPETLRSSWTWEDRQTGVQGRELRLAPRDLRFLRRVG